MVKSSRSRNARPGLREEILAGLQHLRSEAKEISRMHAANLQRDMVQLIDCISDPQNGRLRSQYAQLKKTLDELHLRPEKGRRKDLRKIEQAVRSMMKLAFNKNANV
jgi:hypothetical protein